MQRALYSKNGLTADRRQKRELTHQCFLAEGRQLSIATSKQRYAERALRNRVNNKRCHEKRLIIRPNTRRIRRVKHPIFIFSLSMEMSRLTRDGTAEPVSRDQILRHARVQGNIHFSCSADHEQDWQPDPVDPYSATCDDHTYIHTYIHIKSGCGKERRILIGPW